MRRVEDMIIYEIDEEAERQQEVNLFNIFVFLARIQVFNKNYVNFLRSFSVKDSQLMEW